ncbi:MAG: 2-C-methyl-D-erythritol 4-phosphate cytidylyltransferase, partial [Deltaproteobacteria bacterium]|nr:2-C-methyl-D-erythritol 4-phosphate cytidylyltransferase [Deltaproteobacteria bacterium]
MNQNFNSVIIVAGGSGSRMKSEIPKQFLPIANRPLLIYCLEAFEASSKINEMILVLPEDWISYFEEKILPLGTLSKL